MKHPTRVARPRLRPYALALATLGLACVSLSYPEPPPRPGARPSATGASTARTAGAPARALDARPAEDEALGWSELTRLAREHRKRGELDEAERRLDQAARQLTDLPASRVERRTVFGMQARLARELAQAGELARADALADRLFALADAEPEIGGASLTLLARAVVARRSQAEPPLSDEEKLRILGIALTTAQAGPASRERLQLAFEISQTARRAGHLELARRAIEQAQADARTLAPGDKNQAASIAVYRARIALAGDDLATAEAAAVTANRLFEEIDAPAAQRGVGEITLAQAIARRGETDKALLVARTAEARLTADEPVSDHARRTILGGLARVEAIVGETESARQHYRAALDVPGMDSAADRELVRELGDELRALEAPTPAP
jgi:hypothetical protein